MISTRASQLFRISFAAAAITCASSAQATLTPYDLDGNLSTVEAYFDSNTDLYWTQNANLAGALSWPAAYVWADGLTFSGQAESWRLPTVDTDCKQSAGAGQGYDCGTLTGELNIFYYTTLGGGSSGIAAQHNSNYDVFSNVQGGRYWAAQNWEATKSYPEVTNAHPDYYWFFGFGNGTTFGQTLTSSYSVWAVTETLPMTATAIPEPATVAMLAAGLALIGARRRKA